jgi:mannose-6-phosphate isomerase-like protein (cupin superfamily)
MVEMKNVVKEADANPGVNHLSLWRTDLAYFWVINCEPKVQDDMHYHENDDHIFMVIEGECTVRTPRKEFVLKQFDTVLLKSGESYQLCNTGTGRMLLLGAGNAGVNGQPRTPYSAARTRHRIIWIAGDEDVTGIAWLLADLR